MAVICPTDDAYVMTVAMCMHTFSNWLMAAPYFHKGYYLLQTVPFLLVVSHGPSLLDHWPILASGDVDVR